MLALGDSLTYGTGASPQTSYPSVLAQLTGWKIINAGVPGETASQGCERLPLLLDEHKPALVLVLLGGNDFLRRRPDTEVTAALKRCVATARAAATSVALIPVPRLNAGGLSDAAVYREASGALGVPLIDAGLAELLGRRSMRADSVHLNEQGYREMAVLIAKDLRSKGLLAH